MVASDENINQLLRSAGLSGTFIRRRVVELLSGYGVALTQKEIEEKLPANTDRVTLYRTLKLFCERGVVHKIVIDENKKKYKLAGHFRRSDHAHFFCIYCQKLLCMPHLEVDTSRLPAGFELHATRLVVEGVCNNCKKK